LFSSQPLGVSGGLHDPDVMDRVTGRENGSDCYRCWVFERTITRWEIIVLLIVVGNVVEYLVEGVRWRKERSGQLAASTRNSKVGQCYNPANHQKTKV